MPYQHQMDYSDLRGQSEWTYTAYEKLNRVWCVYVQMQESFCQQNWKARLFKTTVLKITLLKTTLLTSYNHFTYRDNTYNDNTYNT